MPSPSEGELGALIDEGAKPQAVASALLRELQEDATPSLVVLEDLHWADEATLDVLRLTARRLDGVGALLLLTYRNDELGRWHPLRTLIGELGASQTIVRISLAPLSLDAVKSLAEPFDGDGEMLYRRTGGNPFFVTELLAGVGETVPDSVADAVLARAARLSPSARQLLEAIAVTGPRAELWLLDRLAGQPEPVPGGMPRERDDRVRRRRGGVPARADCARRSPRRSVITRSASCTTPRSGRWRSPSGESRISPAWPITPMAAATRTR